MQLEAEIANQQKVESAHIETGSNTASAAASRLLEKIRQIMGPYHYPRPAATVAEDKKVYQEGLDKKYL